jgi:hypothetical protein
MKMKLLFILLLIGIDGITVYVYSSKTLDRTKKTLYSKPLTITAVVAIISKSSNLKNVYISNCTGYAVCYDRYYNYTMLLALTSVKDFFAQGNHD